MNYIWCLMIIVSIVVSIFNGTVDQTINGAFEGAKSAVFTVLSFAGVMCFWTGIMKIAEKCGIVTKIREIIKTYNKLPVSQCRTKRKKIYCREYECQHTRNGQCRNAYGYKGYAMS